MVEIMLNSALFGQFSLDTTFCRVYFEQKQSEECSKTNPYTVANFIFDVFVAVTVVLSPKC